MRKELESLLEKLERRLEELNVEINNLKQKIVTNKTKIEKLKNIASKSQEVSHLVNVNNGLTEDLKEKLWEMVRININIR